MKTLSLQCCLLLACAAALVSGATSLKDSDLIRGRRAAYTAAIEARDPTTMRELLAEDMVQLSSNGQTTVGRDAVIQSYSQNEFRNPRFQVYERTPDRIVVSDNRRFGVEQGHWRGRFRQTGGQITGNAGLYQAGWIKRDGVWLIRTESYVRLRCVDENDCPR